MDCRTGCGVTGDEDERLGATANKAITLNEREEEERKSPFFRRGFEQQNAHNLHNHHRYFEAGFSTPRGVAAWQLMHKQSQSLGELCVRIIRTYAATFVCILGSLTIFFAFVLHNLHLFCLGCFHHPKCGDRLNLSESAINWQLS